MSTTSEEEQVEQACQALKASVTNFLRKCDQKQQEQIQERQGSRKRKHSGSDSSDSISHLVDHACYWLRQMAYKRQSLQLGIQALVQHVRRVTTTATTTNSSSKSSSISPLLQLQKLSQQDFIAWLSSWLQHVFDQYLRLRDGMVLLTSGECRHEGDIAKSQSTRFKSRLKSTSCRADGYTVLYRGEHYCGFSWDEGMDPDVGIQRRLQTALWQYYQNHGCPSAKKKKKKKTAAEVWEQHIAEKTPMYGLVLDQHEVQVNRAQCELDSFRQTLEQDLNRLIRMLAELSMSTTIGNGSSSIRVQLVARDKMERLEVTMGKSTTMVIERRGNRFQIQDERGVLPNRITISEWDKIMDFPFKVPTTATTKHEMKKNANPKVSHDSGGNSCGTVKKDVSHLGGQDPIVTTTTASGLVVRAKVDTDSGTNDNDHNSSVTDIKRQLGVDVQRLEEGLEVLEGEEKLTLQEAQAIDQGIELEEEESDLHNDINRHTSLVEYLKSTKLPKVVQAIEKQSPSRQEQMIVEGWDIREALRQSCMTIGNDWLALHSIDHERQKGNAKPSSSKAMDQPDHLDKALEAFQQALHWVQDQERSHTEILRLLQDRQRPQSRILDADDWDPTQLRISTALYQGRARTNVGIVLFRKWEVLSSDHGRFHNSTVKRGSKRNEVSSLFRSSIEKLELALKSVDELLREPHLQRVDQVLAKQLKALTSRWLGTALWHDGNRAKAVSVMLEQGCDPVWMWDGSNDTTTVSTPQLALWKRHFGDAKESDSDIRDQLEWGVECYYNSTSLVDLAGEALERIGAAAKSNRNEGSKNKAEELLSWMQRALQQAGSISKAIAGFISFRNRSLASGSALSLDDYEIKEPRELEQAHNEFVEWWQEVTISGSKEFALPNRLSRRDLPRNDLLGDHPANLCDPYLPRKRFLVQGDEPWRKKRCQKQRHFEGESTRLVDDTSRLSNTKPPPSERKYRKWGDQLLPQEEIAPGQFVPKIVYPAVAPEMPPEIKRILAMTGSP